jgi:hypothetical protein
LYTTPQRSIGVQKYEKGSKLFIQKVMKCSGGVTEFVPTYILFS